MKIINSDRRFSCTEKRFHIPGSRIETECGKCGRKVVLDLSDNYLSYPTFNEEFCQYIPCSDDDCGYETPCKIRLNIEIEAVP